MRVTNITIKAKAEIAPCLIELNCDFNFIFEIIVVIMMTIKNAVKIIGFCVLSMIDGSPLIIPL